MRNRSFITILAGLALIATLRPAATDVTLASPNVAEPFVTYYNQHQGIRVLGHPLSDLTQTQGYPAQYFEKGRIEDHRAEVKGPAWAFMYGRLTIELIERAPKGKVSVTSVTYGYIGDAADPSERQAPPPASLEVLRACMTVCLFPSTRNCARHPVMWSPPYFWAYINRADLFPGGWLHDVGLPLTE